MSSKGPPSGHQRGRAHAAARVPIPVAALGRAISTQRERNSHRFRQPLAWLRLIVLGTLLINLAVLTFASTLGDRNIAGYWPGTESLFGGLLIAIIVIRLGRPELYLDWISVGGLKVILGILLVRDPSLRSLVAFLVFAFVLVVLAMLKLWIGATLTPGKAAASLAAGSLSGLFCAGFLLVDRFAGLDVGAAVIVTTDLTLTALSIMGLGLALRPPTAMSE